MRYRLICFLIFSCIGFNAVGQNSIDLRAIFNIEKKQISISQTIVYQNTSNDILETIYLNNWSNSYSTKKTPLAIRMADEFKNVFHLAKNEDRGYSVVTSIKQNQEDIIYEAVPDHPI